MKLKIALLFTIIAIGLHCYLTFHHYDLNYGVPSGDSVCNINATFNCDAVAASQYSAVFGIPVALWGAVTNGILAVLILGWILGWTDDLSRLSRYTLWLSGLVACASIVMGGISTFLMSTFCLFCMGTYVLSFATFALLWVERKEFGGSAQEDAAALFGPAKMYLGLLIAIPVLTLFFHLSATHKPQTEAIVRQSKLYTQEWQAATPVQFEIPPVLTSATPGTTAKMVIAEFADFRCSHCRDAAPTLKTFAKTRPDVELQFYTFPLQKIPDNVADSKTCVSCELHKAAMCANEQDQKGWAMHDAMFKAQDDVNHTMPDKIDLKIDELATGLGLDIEKLNKCMSSEETHARLKAIAAMGEKAGVESTPTIFVNGKKLTGGQLMPVLEAVHATLR